MLLAEWTKTRDAEVALPRLGLDGLARWARLGLLEPPYQRRHLERAIELLLLERAVKPDAEGAARQEAATP